MTVINLLQVKPGARLRMKDGSTVTILENPGDGMWLYGRVEGDPGEEEVPIFGNDVVDFAL